MVEVIGFANHLNFYPLLTSVTLMSLVIVDRVGDEGSLNASEKKYP